MKINLLSTVDEPGVGQEKLSEEYLHLLGLGREQDIFLGEEIEDIDVSTGEYIKRRYGKRLKHLEICYVVWVFLLIAIYFLTGFELEVLFWLAVLPMIGYGVFFTNVHQNIRHQFYRQFANLNSFTYAKVGTAADKLGAIFKVGHCKKVENIVSGELAGAPLSIFNYSYTVGRGKGAQHFSQTIFEIDFKTALPAMLLLVDKKYFGDKLPDNNLTQPNKLELPKEVEDHFNLFAEKEYEIEALQIFSPDFLAFIYDNYRDFSFDFEQNQLYVYAKNIIKKKADLVRVFALVKVLIQRLAPIVRQMHGGLKAMQTYMAKQGNNKTRS